MPYYTRDMVSYMQEKGLSKVDEDTDQTEEDENVLNSTTSNTNVDNELDTGQSATSSTTKSFSASSSAPNKTGKQKKRIREQPSCVDSTEPSNNSQSTVPSCVSKSSAGNSTAGSKVSGSLTSLSKSSTGSMTNITNKSAIKHSSSDGGKVAKSTSKSSTGTKSASKVSSSKTSVKSSTGKKNKSSSATLISKSKSSVGSKTSLKSKDSSKNKTNSKSSTGSKCSVANKSSKNTTEPVNVANYTEMTFDERAVKFLQQLLKSNVKRFKEIQPWDKVDKNQEGFETYTINKSQIVAKPKSSVAIYVAHHKHFKDHPLACKMYKVKSAKLMHFKMLRHFGKKHPNILAIWDVYADNQTVYVFEEIASYGNMARYVQKNNPLDEQKTQQCAKQLRIAMDFMGDMAVCHQSIKPRHLFLCHSNMRIKLSGFSSAIIYYNATKDIINYQPCLLMQRGSKEPDYQAPEVYGDPSKEVFDPVTADVWSCGATIYFLASGKYPYEFGKENPLIEDEIQHNVRYLKLSKEAQSLLGNMLTTNSTKRMSVDKMKNHPWLMEQN